MGRFAITPMPFRMASGNTVSIPSWSAMFIESCRTWNWPESVAWRAAGLLAAVPEEAHLS